MPRWKKEDVSRLRQLVGEGCSLKEIATGLDRSIEAVRMKMRRLGLNVVDHTPSPPPRSTTNELENSGELITVQEALEILAAALKAAKKEGLDSVEIQRLNAVATLARTYENLFARFMQYREIEKRVVELEAKYERLAKEKG